MQQVNLYLESFKRTEPLYSAKTMLFIAIYSAVFAVLVAVVLFVMAWMNGNESKTLSRSLIDWQNNFEQAQKDYPRSVVDSNLIRQIEMLDHEKSSNDKILAYLQTHNLNIEQQSFSVYLLALTWIKEPGLWLTEVRITDGGKSLTLIGRTSSAELLPNYLDKIAQIDLFTEMNFKVFDMKRDKQGLKFVVSSKREEAGDESIVEKYLSVH